MAGRVQGDSPQQTTVSGGGLGKALPIRCSFVAASVAVIAVHIVHIVHIVLSSLPLLRRRPQPRCLASQLTNGRPPHAVGCLSRAVRYGVRRGAGLTPCPSLLCPFRAYGSVGGFRFLGRCPQAILCEPFGLLARWHAQGSSARPTPTRPAEPDRQNPLLCRLSPRQRPLPVPECRWTTG